MSAWNGTPRILDSHGRPYRDGDAHSDPRGIVLPHVSMFVARYQGGQNNYLHDLYDEAMRASREDALVMRRDSNLDALLKERYRAVQTLPFHLETPDEKDPHQTAVKDCLKRAIDGIPEFRKMMRQWLEATWFGKSATQHAWKYVRGRYGDGKTRKDIKVLTVADYELVNGDKIGHQFDHTPYILVNPSMVNSIPGAEYVTTNIGGYGLVLRGTWRERFIIHRYFGEDVDYFDPQQAEAIHGVGLRSKLFWINFLKLQWLGNITNFFDRVGLGVTLWKYPQGNPAALAAVKQAALEQSDRSHLFIPFDEAKGKDSSSVERIEVPTSGADALLKLIEYVDKIIERYIVGQEGSASATSANGHSNQSSTEFQQQTKSQITAEDAYLLGETLTGSEKNPGLVSIMLKHTFPEADFPVKFVFDLDTGESQERLTAIKTLVDMGVKTRAEDARKAAGVGKPADGDEIIEPPQQQGQPGAPGAEGAAGGGEEQPQEGPRQAAGGPEAAQEQKPQGDLLDALRMARELADAARYQRVEEPPAPSHHKVGDVVRYLRQRGRDDLAGEVLARYVRVPEGTPGAEEKKDTLGRVYHDLPGGEEVAPPREHAEDDDTSSAGPKFHVANLPSEKQKAYRAAFTKALDSFPPGARKAALANIASVTFHPDIEALTNHARGEGLFIRSGQKVGGLCVTEPRAKVATLHLDGGDDTGEEYGDQAAHLYAHELGHAIDVNATISGKSDWVGAWKAEIDVESDPVSRYSRKSAREGWAEYARLVSMDRDVAREKFPKCWAIWEKGGLI